MRTFRSLDRSCWLQSCRWIWLPRSTRLRASNAASTGARCGSSVTFLRTQLRDSVSRLSSLRRSAASSCPRRPTSPSSTARRARRSSSRCSTPRDASGAWSQVGLLCHLVCSRPFADPLNDVASHARRWRFGDLCGHAERPRRRQRNGQLRRVLRSASLCFLFHRLCAFPCMSTLRLALLLWQALPPRRRPLSTPARSSSS